MLGKPSPANPQLDWTRDARSGRYFWRATWYDAAGARQRKACPWQLVDLEAARAWAIQAIKDGGKDNAKKTLAKIVPMWLALKEKDGNLDPSTYRQYKSHANNWLLNEDSDCTHADIAELDLEKDFTPKVLREWIRSINKAPFTVRNIVQTFRAFYDDARGEEWIDLAYNPLQDNLVKKAMPKQQTLAGKNVVITCSMDQVNGLLSAPDHAIEPYHRLRYLADLLIGTRDGELMGLKFGDISSENGVDVIKIERQIVKYKAERKENGETKQPKKASYRTVPIHPELKKALDWWKSTGWFMHVGRMPKDDDYIFAGPHGGIVVLRSAELLRGHLRALNFDDQVNGHNITFHALRRTFYSTMLENGVQSAVIAMMMGHRGKTIGETAYLRKDLPKYYAEVCKLSFTVRAFEVTP